MTGRSLSLLMAALAALAVAGCAGPTPYQPAANGEGYAEQQLEGDRYRVTFAGNSVTPREAVENGLLLRAAELTRQTGHDHFVIVDQDVERTVTYRTTLSGLHDPAFHHFHGHRLHPHGFGGFATGTARPIDRYKAYANIVVHKGAAPQDMPNAYDAGELIQRLRPAVAATPAD